MKKSYVAKNKLRFTSKLVAFTLSFCLILPNTSTFAASDGAIAITDIQTEVTVSDDQLLSTVVPSKPVGGVDTLHGIKEKPSDDAKVYNVSDLKKAPKLYAAASMYSEMMVEQAQINAPRDITFRYAGTILNSAQKELYDLVVQTITEYVAGADYKNKDYSKETAGNSGYRLLDFSYKNMTRAESDQVIGAVRDDYPEFFWLSGNYYLWDAGATWDAGFALILCKDYATPESRAAVQAGINAGLEEYFALIDSNDSDYEIVEKVHNHLIDTVDYSTTNGKPTGDIWAHSIAGAFDDHHGVVCEGYAKTMQFVLNQLGVDTIYITGSTSDGLHAWNLVKINGKYYYLDATWDDSGNDNGDGVSYVYYCIPSSIFKKDHKDQSPKTIPAGEDSMEMTYYRHYGTDITQYTSAAEVKSAIAAAGAIVPTSEIEIMFNESTRQILWDALQVGNVWSPCSIGNIVSVSALPYQVKVPADSVTLDKTEVEIDRDKGETATITATLTSSNGATDDKVIWKSDNNNVKLRQNGNAVTITANKVGTSTVTATSAVGGASASCTVTVTGIAYCDHIFSDAECTTIPDEEALAVWVNGSNYGPTKETKYNYKAKTVFTDLTPSDIVTTKNGKTTKKAGKLVVGVTMSSEEPTLNRGKIVDATAANIAKASIKAKTGQITVTAGKQTGTVYVWIVDTGDEGKTGFFKVDVLAAPAKIVLNTKTYTNSDREAIKKTTLAVGDSLDVYLEPLFSSKGTDPALDSTYSVSYSKGGDKFVQAECIDTSEYKFKITALGLDPAKDGKQVKATVNFICNENGKKVSIAITITNPAVGINFAPAEGSSIQQKPNGANVAAAYYLTSDVKLKTTGIINVTPALASTKFLSTDKIKVMKIGSSDGFTVDRTKNKITGSKASGDANKLNAKLDKQGNIELSVPSKLTDGVTAYFLVYYNVNCYSVISLTVGELSTPTPENQDANDQDAAN